MLVRDVMHRNLPVIQEEATVAEAARLMSAGEHIALSVVNADGRLTGIISERDILINLTPDEVAVKPYLKALLLSAERWLPYYHDLLKVYGNKVKEVMTTEVITVSEDDSLEKVAEILIESEKDQLPVVRDGKPVGMIDRFDLIKAFASNPT
jgi:CBS domain-containing protein